MLQIWSNSEKMKLSFTTMKKNEFWVVLPFLKDDVDPEIGQAWNANYLRDELRSRNKIGLKSTSF